MNNLGFNITIALLSFTFGIGLTFLFHQLVAGDKSSSNTSEVEHILQPNFNERHTVASPDGKVEVRFKHFIQTNEGAIAEFDVTNNNSEPAFYQSYQKETLIRFIKFNDNEEYNFICGNGLHEFVLSSNDSFVTQVPANQFYKHFKKGGYIQVGYYFKGKGTDYQKVWSDKFQIPKDLKKQIIKETPAWLRNQ